MVQVVFEMQPRDTGAQAGGGATKEELVGIFQVANKQQYYFWLSHLKIFQFFTRYTYVLTLI